MSGLTLTLRQPLTAPADLAALTAAGWESAAASELAARTVRVDRASVPIGELFTVAGEPGATLTIDGDLSLARHVGARLALGTVTVRGGVGDDAGLAMQDGLLLVHGNAGHNLGGAPPGAKRGMTGGEICVHGSAGDEAGACVRRGTIAIGGNAGARTGRACIAGTVYVAGDCGAETGLFGKRVSVLIGGTAVVPAGFAEACEYDPVFVRLLQRRFVTLGFPLPAAQAGGTWRRYSGDAAEGARGELLLWTP